MARTRKTNEVRTEAYRHSGDKRKNIPSAKIAAEGEIPAVKKAKYYYSPHLAPELRFDPTGKADQVAVVREKANQYLTDKERKILKDATTQQQPWLEWSEKKEQFDRGGFDVDPVALHIHERVSAQALVRAAMREDAQRDLFADPQLPYQQEVQFYRHDIDWANRIVLGDSLQVMSSLARRENLAGKVQMIYMDPPYGIKFASNFQPELAKRDVKDKSDDMTREPEMVKAYRDTWNLGIHSYLAYLRDRFIVAKELLADTGSIFVQISDENIHRVRNLMDEIFGPENFQAIIIYRTSVPLKSIALPSIADFVIWYARDKERMIRFDLFEERERGEGGIYTNVEEPCGHRRTMTESERADPKKVPAGCRIYGTDNLVSSGYTTTCTFQTMYDGVEYTPSSGKSWKTNKEGMSRLMEAHRVNASGKTLRAMMYFEDYPVFKMTNLWTDTKGESDKQYVVQTATKVIQRCMLMTTRPGDLVLDPTCGSGTTAFVAEQWGRRWITVDTSRVSVAIARQRLLTAQYEFLKLQRADQGPSGGLVLRTVPHVTLKSIAQNPNLDPVFAKYQSLLDAALSACNKLISQVTDAMREKCRNKLFEKQAREGKRAVAEADRRRWELPKKGEKWEHWELPFDTDQDWPKPLQEAVIAYRKVWRAKMDDVNACVAQNAEQEELVDQPEVVRGVVRVSGPFTVEGVRPEELSMGEDGLFDGTPNEWENQDIRDEVQNVHAYLSRMVELLRKDGVVFPNNKHLKFGRLESIYETKTGTALHAEGNWESNDEREPNKVAVAFGPQYGPVTAEQVEELIRASKRYDELVIAGFSFDSEASGVIQEGAHPKLKIHMAHIRPDVSPGMDGLLKDTPNSQLFTVFGQPEIKVKKHGKDEIAVELLGVDIFDPLKGEVRSTGADKVAAWFLDSDYDGRCFCITQAFFPDQDAWAKIAKALGSQADEDAFEAFKGTVSLPFRPGKHRRIAIKVIDPRGNEVMAIEKLGEV